MSSGSFSPTSSVKKKKKKKKKKEKLTVAFRVHTVAYTGEGCKGGNPPLNKCPMMEIHTSCLCLQIIQSNRKQDREARLISCIYIHSISLLSHHFSLTFLSLSVFIHSFSPPFFSFVVFPSFSIHYPFLL